MHNVVIIGAGGNSKVIADIVVKNGDNLLGFLDDNKIGKVIGEYEVIGKIADAYKFAPKAEFIVSIGDNCIRKKIAEELEVDWYTAIHPSAQIGLSAQIGEGTCVMANAVINPDAHVGKHCIINSSSVVEHDDRVADYVHISPNAALCGGVAVGNCTHIGAGVVVRNGISICGDVVVGAGAVVVKDIEESGKYIGVPAKKMN